MTGSHGWGDGLYRRKDDYELIYKRSSINRRLQHSMCSAVLPRRSRSRISRNPANRLLHLDIKVTRPTMLRGLCVTFTSSAYIHCGTQYVSSVSLSARTIILTMAYSAYTISGFLALL
ncbi:hypothetical protein M422DRAFT_31269, partial [Sphaerobolus stellatus SS14]